MKNLIFLIIPFVVQVTITNGQLSKVHERCEQMPCESGLYCVELKSGEKKCSECDQSKLNDLTGTVDKLCHACEENGFSENAYKENGPIFQEAKSSDNRVRVDVYDEILEIGKKCKEAREYREGQCWDGGDSGHKRRIYDMGQSIEKVSARKKDAIDEDKVYYCSKSTYESKLSTFKSKCDKDDLEDIKEDIEDINSKFSQIINDPNSTDKINCSSLETFVYDCQRCSEAANALMYDGFQNNVDKFPKEYFELWNYSEETIKKGQELLKNVKDKSKCN